MRMNRMLIYLLIMGILGGAAVSQDLRDNAGRSLFADLKAHRVGDAVTILVVESSSALSDAKTSTSRESGLFFSSSGKGPDKNLPDLSLDFGSGNRFKGEGATSNRGLARAKISARVDSVLAGGNLSISGGRTIVVNGEEQMIRVSGVVRPSDIQADNSVYSFNISDATIIFEGSGIVSKAQGPGIFTKLLRWLF